MKHLLKTTMLLLTLMSTPFFGANAQKSISKGLTAKVDDTRWESNVKVKPRIVTYKLI